MGYIGREVKRVGTRIVNTYEGFAVTFKEEASFAQWVVINIVSITLTCVFDMTSTERLVLVVLGLLILVVELLNTGIEAAIDRIGPEIHPQSKKAKDVGCAAVALMAAIGLLAWIMILLS